MSSQRPTFLRSRVYLKPLVEAYGFDEEAVNVEARLAKRTLGNKQPQAESIREVVLQLVIQCDVCSVLHTSYCIMSCCKSRNIVEVIKQSHTKLRM